MATVLIVDDEDRFRTQCADFFERHKWNTLTAADGEEAIAILDRQRNKMDAMILDRSMPGKSGDDVVEWLYEHQALDDICVIMLTAHSDYDNAVETLQAGAWQYLTKPIALDQLLRILAPGVARKKCHRRQREILASESLNSVVEEVRRIIQDTLSPDWCQVIFVSPSHSAEMPDHSATAQSRAFVTELMEGKPYVSGSDRETVRHFEPILGAKAGSLMAVPVSDIHSAIIGVLDIESCNEKAFSNRWIEVLGYAADLIGTFETVRDAREVKEIALINRELRHRLATSVNILSQQVSEARRRFGDDPSPDNPLDMMANHVGIINSVMDELREIIRKGQPLQITEVSPFEVLAKVHRGDGLIPFQGPERPAKELVVKAADEALRYCLDCIVQNALEAVEFRRLQDPSARDVRKHYVRLSVTDEQQWVRIRVEDTGVGFTEEIEDRLFAPLFTTKTRKGHEGIGLFSVKRMIQEMGGRVDAFSAGEFQGATFTVSLLRA